MTEAKKTQDKKKSKDELKKFSIEYNGETYDMVEGKSFNDVMKPGFVRKNRNQPDSHIVWTMLELLYSEEVLETTVDDMDNDAFMEFADKFMEAFQQYNGASVGE